MAKYRSHLGAIWPWWDKMHLASQQLPHKGSHHKKEPIIWKNRIRTWVRIGSGETKRTLPASKSHTKAATTERSQSHGKIQTAPACYLALMGRNSFFPASTCSTKAAMTKREPIIWKNTDRTWVRSGPAGAKCTFPANTCSTQAAMTKREPIIWQNTDRTWV